MLTVLTLGGAAVVGEPDGPDLPGATQRRTLALLGVLAVASTHGMSRDKLIALFWPDAEPDRASHSLTQALYAARRGLDCDDLFLLGNEIRLNPERIRSDVAMFEAAFSAGRLEEATSLYRGAFLDGFYLTGSAGFERWQSVEQTRLETIAVEAFECLAEDAERTHDFRKAADWLRRLAAIRPLDSRIAVRFMESLALSGDRAGALRHGYVHSELLRQELELTPDEHVASLTARIREGTFGRPPAARTFGSDFAAEPTSSVVVNPMQHGTVAEAPPTTSVPSPIDRSVRVRFAPARAGLWVTGIAATLVAGAIAVGTIRDTPGVVVSPRPQSIVVMPFRVSGANPSLAYMKDGMVELLSPRLDSDSGTRAIDAGAVLGALRQSAFGNQPDVPRDSLIRLAARLGAERVVLGNVVGTGGRFVVQATVFRTANAAVTARASAEGTVDSLPRAIDFLVAKLLVSEAGEDPALVVHGIPSLPALRAFLAGQAAARRGSYAAALRWFRQAISRDSSFSASAIRLALLGEEINDARATREGVGVAWRSFGALNSGQKALLAALAGPRFPAISTVSDQLRAWQHLADLAAPAADEWFVLGSRLFHDGRTLSVPDAGARAQSALARTLVANPSHFGAQRMVAQLNERIASGDPSTQLQVRLVHDSSSPAIPFIEWLAVSRRGDGSDSVRRRRALRGLSRSSLREIALASQYDVVRLRDGQEALRSLAAKALTAADSADLLLAEHSLALNEGRFEDALQTTARLAAVMPSTHVHWRLRILDAIYGGGDSTVAEAAIRRLSRFAHQAQGIQPMTLQTRIADACVIAQWRLALGDTSGVPDVIQRLRGHVDVSPLPLAGSSSFACAELLSAGIAVATHSKTARERLAQLDSLAFTPTVAGDAAIFAPLFIARLHERLGDYPGALRALDRRPYMTGWPRYSAQVLREQAHLAQITGDSAIMVAAERDYFRFRPGDEFGDTLRTTRR